METIILLGVVSMAGYYLNQNGRENLRNINEGDSLGFPELQKKVPDIQKPVSTNIYNSNMVEEANNEVLRLSLKNYKDSANPELTGILPPIYNSYSLVGNTNIGNKDPTLKDLSDINNINRYADISTNKSQQTPITQRPMFNPSNVGTASTSNPFTNYGNGLQSNSEISLLTGLPIDKEHNNLQPFFGGSVKQNIETFTNESKLDAFTGNTSTFFHKQEVPEFFSPVAEYNINGSTKTVPLTENIELDRYIPSVYRQGEKPFYEERISAPIAYTENNPLTKAGSSFPTIDELRVGNKPQISYAGRLKAPVNPVGARGNIGTQAKNRVDASFILGQDRWNTTTGAYVNKKADENYNNMIKTSRQDQNIEYYGTAKNTQSLKNQQRLKNSDVDNSDELNFDAIFQNSTKQILNTDTIRNKNTALNPNIQSVGLGSNTYANRELERDTTKDFQLTNVNKSDTGHQIGLQDTIRNTIKQTTLYQDNSGNIVSTLMKDSNTTDLGTDYTFRTTNKESLVEHKYNGQPTTKDNMGYNIANYNAKTTNKETTNNPDYKGAGNFYNPDLMDRTEWENPIKVRNASHATDYQGSALKYIPNEMDRSEWENPIKVRNASHVENYQGTGIRYTQNSENRDKYLNADITEKKEKLLEGEHPRGKNSGLSNISAGKGAYNVSVKPNTLFKEQDNLHTQNIDNISSNIPSIAQMGQHTQHRFAGQDSEIDTFNTNISSQSNRFNADLISSQLNANPFYNLKNQ